MSNIGCVAVPGNVAGPLELARIGVASSHVAGLELLQLLLRAEFVGLNIRLDASDKRSTVHTIVVEVEVVGLGMRCTPSTSRGPGIKWSSRR